MKSLHETKHKKIAAIILAAGSSSRFGEPKQLLMWREDTLLNTCIRTAEKAGLSPIVVVLGSNADLINASISHKTVDIIVNKKWHHGQGSSVKAGVERLERLCPGVEGAFFLLVDQPQISVALIEAIKDLAFAQAQVALPIIENEPANPVYFSKICFEALKQIKGEQGGRAVFPLFELQSLAWNDTRQAIDIDTAQDYARLRALYGIIDTNQV